MDRLSFVIQQVSDILLEKSLINFEHLHTVEIVMNSFLQYLQRLKSSIPLGSVITPPKMSMEIGLLYGLSKLYVRLEPHVSTGLKILMPLLAKLRSDDKLINLNKLDSTINNENISNETDPGSIIASNLNSTENLENEIIIDDVGIMDGEKNGVDVYLNNKNEEGSEMLNCLENVGKDEEGINDFINSNNSSDIGISSINDSNTISDKIFGNREEENVEESITKVDEHLREEDQKAEEEEEEERVAENAGENGGEEEVCEKVTQKEVEKDDELKAEKEKGKQDINILESDIITIDKQIQKKEKEEKEEKEEELKMKQEAQIFLLRQRLRIAEELTNIGKE